MAKIKRYHESSRKEHLSLAEAGKVHGIMGKIIRNKGLLLALIVVAILILLFVLRMFSTDDISVTQEKAAFAKTAFEQNQQYLSDTLTAINDDNGLWADNALDSAFLASTKSDVEWLLAKEKEIFNSKPSGEVYAKEVAYTLFMQTIIGINQAYVLQINEPNYAAEEAKALSLEIVIPTLLEQEDLAVAFTNDAEIKVYDNTVRSLFEEYSLAKKTLIRSADTEERRYAEAKKLNWLVGDTNS